MTQVVDRLRTLMASDLMARRVVELSADDSLDDAAQSFVANELTSAPVVDRQGICIGMLSAADFLKSNRRDDVVSATSLDGNVRTLMTSAVQSVSPSTSLLRLAQIMSVGHLHHLPVIADERLVGVVSTLDVVSALVNAVDELDAQ
jgi:CBS-domain-containing membrane protein